MGSSHYDLLGVDPDASRDEIRQAYRRLARQLHPDLQPQSDRAALSEAQRRMATVTEAYSVLADPTRRQAYDVAIGRPHRRRPVGNAEWRPLHDDDGDERFDRLGEDEARAGTRKPADLVMLVPAALAVLTLATFVLGVALRSHALWALAVIGTPVSIVAFVAAPLVSMLRARSRDQLGA